jgi:hypothetical protein
VIRVNVLHYVVRVLIFIAEDKICFYHESVHAEKVGGAYGEGWPNSWPRVASSPAKGSKRYIMTGSFR